MSSAINLIAFFGLKSGKGYSDHTGIINKFPNVFTGLGLLSGEFEIQDAKPFALYTPRKVPYPLQFKVKEE